MADHSNVFYAAAVKVIVASTCYYANMDLNEYLLSLLTMYADFTNANTALLPQNASMQCFELLNPDSSQHGGAVYQCTLVTLVCTCDLAV